VEDAIGFVQRIGAPVTVVGHDWGALVAWGLAAVRPDLVRRLVAVSVPHPQAYRAAMADDADQQRRASYIALLRQEGKAEHVLLADDAARLREMLPGCLRPGRTSSTCRRTVR
jgi:pimeloyl-ACP methyl ester carboxylesterase